MTKFDYQESTKSITQHKFITLKAQKPRMSKHLMRRLTIMLFHWRAKGPLHRYYGFTAEVDTPVDRATIQPK